MFEVNGLTNPTYCENLCLLTRLYLEHKNLDYNSDIFLFIIMCEIDEFGHHIVGFFSKEKSSIDIWNLNCIMVLPFA